MGSIGEANSYHEVAGCWIDKALWQASVGLLLFVLLIPSFKQLGFKYM